MRRISHQEIAIGQLEDGDLFGGGVFSIGHALAGKLMIKFTFAIIFFSATANSFDFAITEIFLAKSGRRYHEEEQWIEITNTSPSVIPIETLELAIYESDQVVFKKSIKPVDGVLTTRALIAQQRSLGLNFCVRKTPVFLITGFRLTPARSATICVHINGKHQACTNLTKSLKPKDGVALFREIIPPGNSLWLNEPCRLHDRTFATPGLPARACVENPRFFEEIFTDCKPSPAKIITLNPLGSHMPHIKSHEFHGIDGTYGKVTVDFDDDDVDDDWWLTVCATKQSKKICHIVDETAISPGKDVKVKLPDRNAFSQLYFQLHDLFGNIVEIDGGQFPHPHAARAGRHEGKLPVVIRELKGTTLRFGFSLDAHDLPLNVAVKSGSDIIFQRSFVEQGSKSFDVFARQSNSPISIIYSDENGNYEQLLSNDLLASGCTQNTHPWWIIATILFLIRPWY